jgi:hypothetical protein
VDSALGNASCDSRSAQCNFHWRAMASGSSNETLPIQLLWPVEALGVAVRSCLLICAR